LTLTICLSAINHLNALYHFYAYLYFSLFIFFATLTAWSLQVAFPFSDNEALDDQHSPFVKISNILTDTTDGVKLFAQFELTSVDHLSRDFNLSLTECEALKHLNISHALTLPPNKSMLVNMTLSLPFFTHRKEQKCKGTILCEFNFD
jgi:hypothetical protein